MAKAQMGLFDTAPPTPEETAETGEVDPGVPPTMRILWKWLVINQFPPIEGRWDAKAQPVALMKIVNPHALAYACRRLRSLLLQQGVDMRVAQVVGFYYSEADEAQIMLSGVDDARLQARGAVI